MIASARMLQNTLLFRELFFSFNFFFGISSDSLCWTWDDLWFCWNSMLKLIFNWFFSSVIRCRDLSRSNGGPVSAYVKVSLTSIFVSFYIFYFSIFLIFLPFFIFFIFSNFSIFVQLFPYFSSFLSHLFVQKRLRKFVNNFSNLNFLPETGCTNIRYKCKRQWLPTDSRASEFASSILWSSIYIWFMWQWNGTHSIGSLASRPWI